MFFLKLNCYMYKNIIQIIIVKILNKGELLKLEEIILSFFARHKKMFARRKNFPHYIRIFARVNKFPQDLIFSNDLIFARFKFS